VHNSYLTPIAFQLFILAMALMIIIQWVNNYNERIRLESSLRFKNKVLSVIAHDLKNPIASVSQFTELLGEKPELIKKKHVLDSLQESSHSAVSLLENLLFWSRSESDELTVSPEAFDIKKLVDEVASLFVHMSYQKELEFTVDVKPGIMAYADRMLVHTVLRNLVSNAIKFTHKGGSVSIRAGDDTSEVTLSVEDTGVGIEPAILEEFERVGKLESSRGTDKELGTGLGLQLVSDLVTRNGGHLHIRSKPGQGSAFTFTLPPGRSQNKKKNEY
jgi:signal transduction histidine kinase